MKHLVRYAALLLVTFATFGCKSEGESPYHSTPDVTISIVAENGANSFSPNPANVTVGQKVAWSNAAGSTHTATENNGVFDTGHINSGSTSDPIEITTAGDLAYHCSIHPTMVGTLHVTQ